MRLDAGPRHARRRRPPPHPKRPNTTQAIAAIRESFEELGILLARHASGPRQGQMADAQDIAAIDRHPVLPSNAAPAACAWRPTACSCWPTDG